MVSTTSIVLSATVLASCFMSAFAISCYQCNSAVFPECEHLDVRRPDLIAAFYQKCNDTYDGAIPFCRKTDLTVMSGDLRRTIRSCGWVKKNEKTTCYKADNDDHLETVCQCFEDGCNAAHSMRTPVTLIGAAVALLLAAASARRYF